MTPLPTRKIIPLAAFAALMAAALPVNWAFVREQGAKLGDLETGIDRLLRGKVTEDLTARYNGASPFKEFGIDLFGSLSFFAFNEARSGALIGADGMLFSVEEFESDAGSAGRVASAISHVASVNAALAARGISLIVAPLPLKADIEGRSLGPHLRLPDELANRHATVMAGLAAAGVMTVDVRGAMLEGQATAPVFLTSDTHWTPHGAGLAARAVAKAAASLSLPGGTPFTLAAQPQERHEGDLKTFVRLLPSLRHLGPPDDMLTSVVAESAGGEAGQAGLFEDTAIPVVLVGTSYSADLLFGFEAQLKAALGLDVLNLAEVGKGPIAPMRAFLEGDVLKGTPPRLVIWEMPIRYLDDTPAPADVPATGP